jgi:protein-S-isoprenylcysteine O-methyltransferase Ste14
MFVAFVFYLLNIGIRSAVNKEDPKGKAPINKYLFLLAKITYLLPWLGAFIVALKIDVTLISSGIIAWIAMFLITIGYTIMWLSYIQLGKYTRFGLPTGESKLITSGIYKYCRHPMYLAMYLMIIGITFYFSYWLIIICCFVTVLIHHYILIAEEKYMLNVFGKEWSNYTMKTRRYGIC